MQDEKRDETALRSVLLRREDILDQAVYENTWMAVGDHKDLDLARLIRQGRLKD